MLLFIAGVLVAVCQWWCGALIAVHAWWYWALIAICTWWFRALICCSWCWVLIINHRWCCWVLLFFMVEGLGLLGACHIVCGWWWCTLISFHAPWCVALVTIVVVLLLFEGEGGGWLFVFVGTPSIVIVPHWCCIIVLHRFHVLLSCVILLACPHCCVSLLLLHVPCHCCVSSPNKHCLFGNDTCEIITCMISCDDLGLVPWKSTRCSTDFNFFSQNQVGLCMELQCITIKTQFQLYSM